MSKIKQRATAEKEVYYSKDNNYIANVFNGTTAFICPRCNEIIYIHGDCKIHLHSLHGELDFMSIRTDLICPECGNEFKVDLCNGIDYNIVETIKILNDKGYPTVYSCEGENGGDPYILFGIYNNPAMNYRTRETADMIKHVIESAGVSLPYPWYICDGDFCNDKWPVVCLRAPRMQEDERISALKAIYKWALDLPATDEINKYYDEHFKSKSKKKVSKSANSTDEH